MIKNAQVIICDNPQRRKEALLELEKGLLPYYEQNGNITVDCSDVSFGVHVLEDGLAVHLINYRYNQDAGKIEKIPEVKLILKGNLAQYEDLQVLALDPQDVPQIDVSYEEGEISVSLHDLPVYCALHWKKTR